MDLEATFGTGTPVVGMVHLPPLPGSPEYDPAATAVDGSPATGGDSAANDGSAASDGRERLRERALADARALDAGGVDAVLVENFGDSPYYPEEVPAHVVAEVTAATRAVREAVDCPVGVNVLRNDARAAIACAGAAGGSFVRVNVHTGARVTDQGLLGGRAHETLRLRDRIDVDAAILADVAVKHSAPVAERPTAEVVADAVERGLADGLVASGPATGAAVERSTLRAVADARDDVDPDVPLFVGSGVTAGNVASLLEVADGVVVGTALKEGGDVDRPVDRERVAELVAAAAE